MTHLIKLLSSPRNREIILEALDDLEECYRVGSNCGLTSKRMAAFYKRKANEADRLRTRLSAAMEAEKKKGAK